MENQIPKVGTKEFNDLASACFGGKPKQQTAVEWLEEQLKIVLPILKDEDEILYINSINKAKEMEKQQIIDAVDGFPLENRNLDGKQYYEQTFKKK
jgi:hypothetical protein